MIGPETSIKEISKMSGVKDLPMRVRMFFIRALKAEASGDHKKAEGLLDEAIALDAAKEA